MPYDYYDIKELQVVHRTGGYRVINVNTGRTVAGPYTSEAQTVRAVKRLTSPPKARKR